MQKALAYSLLLVLFIVLFSTAWLSDDAYITFRVLDNFVEGFGLRWNIDERVQVFTNPLWLFSLSIPYLLTGEIFYTSLFFSIVMVLLAVFVLYAKIATNNYNAIAAFFVLIFSKAFIEYSTSGLENPLSYLLIALFFWFYLKKDWGTEKNILLLGQC